MEKIIIKKDELNKIKKEYKKGSSLTTLSEKYPYSRDVIGFRLREIGLNLDHTKQIFVPKKGLFEKIKTEKEAYYLGLLFADGYNNTDRYVIELTLIDEEVVKGFMYFIYGKKTTKKYIVRRGGYNKNGKPIYSVRICDKKISLRLKKLGMVKAKSKILMFPKKIHKKYLKHFIRGYFDGDGSIWITKDKSKYNYKAFGFRILGTEDICSNIGKYFCNNLHIPFSIRNNRTIKEMKICGNRQILNCLNHIYKGSKVKMKRKYRVYLKMKEIQKTKRQYIKRGD